MKRFLSLALVLVLVFGAIMPSFAEVTISPETQDLVTFGIIEGDGTSYNEEAPLTRAQMAKILAFFYGEDETAATYAFAPSFTDMEEDAWYLPWVAYAEAQGWMIGDGANSTFRPNEAMKAQEANMLMLRVLGYGDTPYADATTKAVELGVAITAADNSLVLRGEAFKAIRTVLDATPMDAEMTLGSQLELPGYVSPEPPATGAVAVESVTADNLKALTIMFNQEIDADYLDEIAVTPDSTLTLSEDKMSVAVVYDAAIGQGDEVEIEIEDIEYTWTQRVYDMQDPSLLAIEANSPKELVMTFSEPVDMDETTSFKVYNNIKRDNISLVAKVTDVDHVMNQVTLELPSLLAPGTYSFVVSDIEDFATFEIADTTMEVVIIEDNDAPVATKVEVKNLTTVEVTFDETIAIKGIFKVDGVVETGDTVINGKVATITVPELGLGATVEVRVDYKGQKDLVGNEVANYLTITTSVEDDTTLPEASLVLEEGNDATITFTKTMLTSVGTITVLNADEDEVATLNVNALTFKADTNNTVLELTAAQLGLDDTDPATFSVVIEDMQDATVRKNLLPDATFTINAEDTKNPVIESTYLLTVDADPDVEDQVTFYFSEAMDQDSVKNLSNYIVAGDNMTVANITDAKFLSMGANGKSVTIEIPDAQADNDDYILIGLKDIAGNVASTTTVDKETATGIDFNGAGSVVATDVNTVEVTFNASVASADPSAFYLADGTLGDAGTSNLVFTSATVDGAVVTFTVDGDLPTNIDGYKLIANNTELIVNLYGNDLSDNFPTVANTVTYADGQAIVDEIVPTVELADMTSGAAITLEFSEDMEINGTDLSSVVFNASIEGQFVVLVNGDAVTFSLSSTVDDELMITVPGLVSEDEVSIQYFKSPTATLNLTDAATTPNAIKNFELTGEVE